MSNEKLFIISQYLLPQHLLSRAMGLLTNCKIKVVKNYCIQKFIKKYGVNMAEAECQNHQDYVSFNDFFTRKLKAGIRPIDQDNQAIICPVDGQISQLGTIEDKKLIQAKGFNFTTDGLLGNSQVADKFRNGSFATLYLSPKDYHCFHMPYTGSLKQMTYIPGKLFSVNQTTTRHVPNLFARNERVVCLFDTEFGEMAVVLVGAFFVASIHTIWAGKITPGLKREVTTVSYQPGEIALNKGDLLGHFELGSTVIVLLPKGIGQFEESFIQLSEVKVGMKMFNNITY